MALTPFESESDPGRSPELVSQQRSTLLVIDIQEKLLPVIRNADSLLATVEFLQTVAGILGVPIVVSEQYPKGLGPTVAQLMNVAAEATRFEKLRFSAADEFQKILLQGNSDNPTQSPRDQVVIVGIETHICVLQTALDLIGRGLRVFVVSDAVGSRHRTDCKTALRRVRDGGGVVCSAESVAFEWCEQAGTDAFRKISQLVRNRSVSEDT